MRKLVVLVPLLLISFSFQAAVIRGKIIDFKTGEVVDFANVVLKRAATTAIISGVTSAEDGTFRINNLLVGVYDLEISFVGYDAYSQKVIIQSVDEEKNIGIIKLRPNTETLQEVEVMGQASQMRFDIDKKVFNVDANVAAAGASASDVLENIPSVEVDNDGNISLRNNSSVEVWINGKPSGLTEENRAQILEQMPAGSIEAVEIITNPSAKFSPEGTAGIINLVMKKERKAGYFGSVTAGGDYQLKGKFSGNASTNINYNSSKIDAYANLGFRQRNSIGGGETNRSSFNAGSTDTLSFQHQDNSDERLGWGVFGRAGLDFHIDTKNTIGFSGMVNYGDNKSTEIIDYSTFRYQPIDTTLFVHSSDATFKRLAYNVTLDYKHEFDSKGSELTSSVSYGQHQREQYSDYEQIVQRGKASAYKQNQYSGGNNQTTEFKVDYVKKFSDNMKLETGGRFSWQNRFSNSTTWDFVDAENTNRSDYNDFNYEEWITALYATYGAKFGNFSFQGGLRGEYTITDVGTRDNEEEEYITSRKSYFQLFPTAYLSYTFPHNHELQLNYTRRINRPRGRQLSAFRNVSDSTNISYGNPDLDPEYANSLELNYIKSWEKHVLSASFYYKYTTDVIQRVQFQSPDNPRVMETTYDNVAKSQSLGVELVAKDRLWSWLNLTTTVNLFYQQMSDIVYNDVLLEESSDGFSWMARLMANFVFGKGFTGQLTGSYRSPRVIAQGKTTDSYSLDLGLRKSFLNKTLNLSLTVRDVLNSRSWHTITWGDTFYQDFERQMYGPRFSLTLTYNFGNMKSKKKSQNKEGNDSSDDYSSDDFE
jgi:outer membrane receptor protein involved in Fe transport